MLTLWGRKQKRLCDGISRREFLRVGSLGAAGLSLPDLLRLRAQGAVDAKSAHKAVIMVLLTGGPSHIDMYDLKPEAPAEYRGEFKPIQTNVPGLDICELMPLQAKIADKLALVRNMTFHNQIHFTHELETGFPKENSNRPALGSVLSRLQPSKTVMPPYLWLAGAKGRQVYPGDPGFLGAPYRPFVPGMHRGPNKTVGLDDLRLRGSAERFEDRRELLRAFDSLRRDIDDAQGSLAGVDAFHAKAMEMITTPKIRDAFDVNQEPEQVRAKYGAQTHWLQALRLVEAGASVVTLTSGIDDWDTHGNDNNVDLSGKKYETNFNALKRMLPEYDRTLHALITDLHARGLDKDVAVVVWGEMGRSPRIDTKAPIVSGRDHWPQAGFAVVAGGGLQMGQVIGATNAKAERATSNPYTPQNMLATLYGVLGIDASNTTLPDQTGRPIYLLDDSDKIKELG
jgi:uncharacterized protein (DUF1501 family)